MCGIVGVAGGLALGDPAQLEAMLSAASEQLRSRGPDGEGTWVHPSVPLAFGHRRLAVIDLSPNAAQPMTTEDASALTFNGEIYNFKDLRADLEREAVEFRSRSDTEVLLHACRSWGVERTLDRVRGMFAFAFFDSPTSTLWLARDRFGEKPLYYSAWGGGIAFASELKALCAIPGFGRDLDRAAIELYFRHGCIGGSRSCYARAQRVRPGELVRVRVSTRISDSELTTSRYWDAEEVVAKASATPFTGSLDDAADELDCRLGRAVLSTTISDVPLGAFLSGGIDSVSVTSQLARRTGASVKSFTMGFDDESLSEAPAAARIAAYLDTDHTTLDVTARDAEEVIPHLADFYDEPFADSSQIPTHLLSRLTREHVTVALTGDGGDELFGGYPRFRLTRQAWAVAGRVPPRARHTVARWIAGAPRRRWVSRVGSGLSNGHRAGLEERAAKAAALLRAGSPDDVYRLLVTAFWGRSLLREPPEIPPVALPPGANILDQMTLREILTYLPDDILTKVDRAAMAVSLETRVPLLDPDVFDLAFSLPPTFKIHGRRHKVVLRHLLERHVPADLLDTTKRGFSIPLSAWLRGPLREWAGDLLAPAALSTHGLFRDEDIQVMWAEHLADGKDWGPHLWRVLMFQAWHMRWGPSH